MWPEWLDGHHYTFLTLQHRQESADFLTAVCQTASGSINSNENLNSLPVFCLGEKGIVWIRLSDNQSAWLIQLIGKPNTHCKWRPVGESPSDPRVLWGSRFEILEHMAKMLLHFPLSHIVRRLVLNSRRQLKCSSFFWIGRFLFARNRKLNISLKAIAFSNSELGRPLRKSFKIGSLNLTFIR